MLNSCQCQRIMFRFISFLLSIQKMCGEKNALNTQLCLALWNSMHLTNYFWNMVWHFASTSMTIELNNTNKKNRQLKSMPKFGPKWILFVQCYHLFASKTNKKTTKNFISCLFYFDMFVFNSSWLAGIGWVCAGGVFIVFFLLCCLSLFGSQYEKKRLFNTFIHTYIY